MGETIMSEKTVEERVKKVVSEQLGVQEENIKLEDHLVDDLGADSLDTVELVMQIETEFEVEIPDEVAEKLLTVQSIIDKVKSEKPELAGFQKKYGKSLAQARLFSV